MSGVPGAAAPLRGEDGLQVPADIDAAVGFPDGS